MEYIRPKTIDEYFEINNIDTIFAGGTDLIPRYERGETLPETIIDIKKIDDLHSIKEEGISIEIGAATTIQEIQNNPIIQKRCNALQQATIDFGSVQIRNRATIGGNICNASPAGDTLPPLYALEAKLLLINNDGNRLVKISDFIKGPGQTIINDGEILQKIIIPESYSKSLFYKLGLRQAMAISVINFAVAYEDNKLTIAVGAVAPTVLKFKFQGKMSIDQIIQKVEGTIKPIDDIRATADYRRKVLKNILSYELAKML